MLNQFSSSYPVLIKIKDKLLSFHKPIVMGVINFTDNSFYAGSRIREMNEIIETAGNMLQQGATIIDIGAVSTRHGSKLINTQEEVEILLPRLEELLQHFPEAIISVDTYHAETAKAAVELGAAMVNDISGGTIDKEMMPTVAKLQVPYIMMHMQGLPENMQENPHYENVVREVTEYFVERVDAARQTGIKDIIIDLGFGFGKSVEHNYQLLKALPLFNVFECPILCGLSRKSMINKVIKTKPETALNGTTVLNTIALLNGAQILRVHDVKEAIQAVELIEFYKHQSEE
ncbi:MAG: dihydropteroate synthase [Bacteroidia bacterium]|nr:dihydropteroate synthase [Bacteroidia bacterium]